MYYFILSYVSGGTLRRERFRRFDNAFKRAEIISRAEGIKVHVLRRTKRGCVEETTVTPPARDDEACIRVMRAARDAMLGSLGLHNPAFN